MLERCKFLCEHIVSDENARRFPAPAIVASDHYTRTRRDDAEIFRIDAGRRQGGVAVPPGKRAGPLRENGIEEEIGVAGLEQKRRVSDPGRDDLAVTRSGRG